MDKSREALRAVLENSEWVYKLPERARARVYEDMYEEKFNVGAAVVRKGEIANTWFGVREGLLKVSTVNRSGKTVMFTPLFEGSWGGEGSVLNKEVYRYDIYVMRPARVMYLPGATFRWLLETSLEFNHLILARLNARLGHFIALREVERLADPVARVAQALAVMYNPVLHPSIGGLLPLSQTELGQFIGLSRQSVGTALKRLEAAGLIAAAYGGVAIKKLTALAEFVENP